MNGKGQQMIEAIIAAYKDVESAPDESLNSRQAWLMGASYVAEFTCRGLFQRGLITRGEATSVFKATGGDETDPFYWSESVPTPPEEKCSSPEELLRKAVKAVESRGNVRLTWKDEPAELGVELAKAQEEKQIEVDQLRKIVADLLPTGCTLGHYSTDGSTLKDWQPMDEKGDPVDADSCRCANPADHALAEAAKQWRAARMLPEADEQALDAALDEVLRLATIKENRT